MKSCYVAACVSVMAALLFAGCGKSDEMKKLEAGLNTEIQQKHDDLMKAMAGLDDASTQITSVIAKHDSLLKLFPKQLAGHDTADLVAAKGKLETAKAAMNAWMKGFKPYDPAAKHEDVMASLNKTKDDLTAIGTQLQEALTASKEAIANHAKIADELAMHITKKK